MADKLFELHSKGGTLIQAQLVILVASNRRETQYETTHTHTLHMYSAKMGPGTLPPLPCHLPQASSRPEDVRNKVPSTPHLTVATGSLRGMALGQFLKDTGWDQLSNHVNIHVCVLVLLLHSHWSSSEPLPRRPKPPAPQDSSPLSAVMATT